MKTHYEKKVSLDLNEKWRIFLRAELRIFAAEHPEDKFEINCWVDDNTIITAQEINDFLAENECKERLKKEYDSLMKRILKRFPNLQPKSETKSLNVIR